MIAIVIAIVIAVGGFLATRGVFDQLLTLVGIGASSEANEPTGERAVINTNNINMRKDPSMDAKVIAKLKKGEVVYIQGKQDGWTQIIVEKTGEIGWCSSNFLTVEK
ncbi:MAG: SH3 domain-containing protein [Clostridia bacterium]|nr:SH3 domain-containing protein [Clostridia bacterium]